MDMPHGREAGPAPPSSGIDSPRGPDLDPPTRQQHGQVGGLLLLFALVAGYFSVQVPAFETPDEFQHYAVVQHIVTWYDLPKSEPNTPGLWRQQGVQAPLYYVAGALLTFWLDQSELPQTAHRVNRFARLGQTYATDNRNFFLPHADDGWVWAKEFLALHILRFFSIGLSACTLYAVYRFVRLLRGHQLALLGTATCAFIPQFVFISGAASNDNLINALACLLLWRLAVWVGETHRAGADDTVCFHRRPWELGVILALALLAKLNSLGLLAVTGLAVAWVAWQSGTWRLLWTTGWRMATAVLVIAGWWYGRNLWMYGDLLAWNIWEGNITLRDAPLQIADLRRELPGMLQSFWGQFGWLTVPYPDWAYGILTWVSLLLAAGAILWLWRAARALDPEMYLLENPLVFQACLGVAWLCILILSWLRFMLIAPAAQGRYLFPALCTLALGVSLGCALLPRSLRLAAWGLPAFLLVLSVVTPTWIIRPAYMAPAVTQYADQPLVATHGVAGHDLARPEFRLVGIGMADTFVPGSRNPVFVRLTALNPVSEDYALFLHLRNDAGQIVAQYDGIPGGGLWPTSQWPVTETRTEMFTLVIPRHVETDTTGTIVLGLYNPWTWGRPYWCHLPNPSDCAGQTESPNEYVAGSFRIVAEAKQ